MEIGWSIGKARGVLQLKMARSQEKIQSLDLMWGAFNLHATSCAVPSFPLCYSGEKGCLMGCGEARPWGHCTTRKDVPEQFTEWMGRAMPGRLVHRRSLPWANFSASS